MTDSDTTLRAVTGALLGLLTVALCVRFYSRLVLKPCRIHKLEEGLLVLAYILYLCQSITRMVPNAQLFAGLNRTEGFYIKFIWGSNVSFKLEYAGDLLGILALTCAKLSVCCCLMGLSTNLQHRRMTIAATAFIGIEGVASLFAYAFRCIYSARQPWMWYDLCRWMDFKYLIMGVGICRILTDLSLVAIPIVIISPIRLRLTRKMSTIGLFSFRTLAIIAVIIQLVHLPGDEQYEYDALPIYLCGQVGLFFSITAACVMYFCPVVRTIRSGGVWDSNGSTMVGGRRGAGEEGSELHSLSKNRPSGQTDDV